MKRPPGPAKRRRREIRVKTTDGVWEIWCWPWRGCAPPIRAGACHCRSCDECDRYREEWEAVKVPTVKAQAPGEGLARVEPPKLLAKLPQLGEVLVQPSWDEGVPKGERALFVFVSSTLVKLLLKIENPPLKLLVSGRSYDEAFAALESVLRSDDIPWELDEGPRTGSKKKAK